MKQKRLFSGDKKQKKNKIAFFAGQDENGNKIVTVFIFCKLLVFT